MTTAADLPGNLTPAQLLYPDMEQELASTRKMLERVPDGNNAWKPHEKSMALGQLADHLAELSGFAHTILTTSELDWQTFKYVPRNMTTTSERLAVFDELSAQMKAVVQNADWDALSASWTMRSGEQVFISERKAVLMRTFGLSHMAHHRAQLGVYLRQIGVPVPGMYGPSADEM